MDQRREDFPRISVETYHHWQRIQTNYSDAAIARLHARLAASNVPDSNDALVAHMQSLIASTFDKARPNLRVNGRRLDDLEQEGADVEPFDEALDRHIWSLSDQRLKSDRELATKRRTRPKEIAALLTDLFELQHAEDNQPFPPPPDEDDMRDDPDAEASLAEVEATFAAVASSVEGWQQDMRTQLERSKRVSEVDREIKALQY